MQKFMIERTIPGAGDLTPEQLAEITGVSNGVVADLGMPYVWHESFTAGDKIYCIHSAESEDAIREHARCGGFPVDSVTPIGNTFGPAGVVN